MKIFVTGGAGFIGSHVVDGLLKKGHELVCLTHSKMIERDDVEVVRGDITDKDSLKSMEGCDAVIANAAAFVINPPKELKRKMYEINVEGTKNTLELALKYNVQKVVYTSSVFAIGDTTEMGVANESDLARHSGKFGSLYEKTKHEAHYVAQKLIDENGAPITIAMPGVVFGEDCHSDIGDVIEELVTKKLVGLLAIDTKMNYIHVEDVAQGIILCLEKGKPEPYIISGPIENNLTIIEFTEKLAKIGDLELPKRTFSKGALSFAVKLYRLKEILTGKKQSVNKEMFRILLANYACSNEKAVKELGFSPKPLDIRIKQTIEWYKKKFQA